jgi:hypothetical protein
MRRLLRLQMFYHEGVGGKDDQLISTVEAVYQGQCPDGMKAGMGTRGG